MLEILGCKFVLPILTAFASVGPGLYWLGALTGHIVLTNDVGWQTDLMLNVGCEIWRKPDIYPPHSHLSLSRVIFRVVKLKNLQWSTWTWDLWHRRWVLKPLSNWLYGAEFEKLTYVYLVKKFPTFYGSKRFNTVFTRAHHWSISGARWFVSTTSHPISLRLILILPSHLFLHPPATSSLLSPNILLSTLFSDTLNPC